ncbi:MAG: response regulator [Desulfobacterales bacterium]|nr:response regulator [Desulfobacterales bacterium]
MKNEDLVVLIVDDNPNNLKIMGSIIKEIGYKFVFAQSGEQALAFLDKKLVDLILLDVMMPNIDGYEVCRKLKDRIETREIPIIFVTAVDDDESESKGLDLGAVDYISKPFKPAIFKSRVNTHLKLKKALISEEKSREIERTRNELINRAIDSGSAQVAAMVLHNIGNAITPVKIDIDNILNNEAGETINYINSCYEDLQKNRGDITSYINDNKRGVEVFSYLGELINALSEEHKKRETIFKKMNKTIAHISEILTFQGEYSTRGYETYEDLNLIIKDAANMQLVTAEKKGVIIDIELDDKLPRLIIDKGRIMQVIINLIKNSFEAVSNLAENRRLKINSFMENDFLFFTIADNGIGIEPEQINKIVKFGESNSNSSGFGLYYCKDFVEKRKGVFEINSPGRNKGAIVKIGFPKEHIIEGSSRKLRGN